MSRAGIDVGVVLLILVCGCTIGNDNEEELIFIEDQIAKGDKYGENNSFEEAIQIYESLLETATIEEFPEEYVIIQNKLSNAYLLYFGLEFERADDKGTLATQNIKLEYLEKAIDASNENLKIADPETQRIEYGIALANLGRAFSFLAFFEDKETNIEKSISYGQESIKYISPSTSIHAYGTLQYSLGIDYWELSKNGDKESNLERALEAFQEASTYVTIKHNTVLHAEIMDWIALVYFDLADVRDEEENLEKSISAQKQALIVFSPENLPIKYAKSQILAGLANSDLGALKWEEIYVERSINAHKEALNFLSPEAHPLYYESAQTGLGSSYLLLCAISFNETHAVNAINAYEELLETDVLKNNMSKHASYQYMIGELYLDLFFRTNESTDLETEYLKGAVLAFRRFIELNPEGSNPKELEEAKNLLKELGYAEVD